MSDVPVFGDKRPGVTYVDRPGAYALLRLKDRLAVVETPYGLFLPGGGIDAGESEVEGLARELREEIDHTLVSAKLLGTAEQFNWSQHYQAHFRKIGYFFEVEAEAPARPTVIPEHKLIWLSRDESLAQLAQEFHRFAIDRWWA